MVLVDRGDERPERHHKAEDADDLHALQDPRNADDAESLEARHARDGREGGIASSLGDIHHDLPPGGRDDQQVQQRPGGILGEILKLFRPHST